MAGAARNHHVKYGPLEEEQEAPAKLIRNTVKGMLRKRAAARRSSGWNPSFSGLSWENRRQTTKDTTESATSQLFGKSAATIQAFVKRARTVYRQFGPLLFCLKNGRRAYCGKLYFPQQKKYAKYIVVSDSTSPALLSKFVSNHWQLRRPEVLISITGGAQAFQLNPALLRVFNNGLVEAAASANAWLITGGTDTGVMRLAANAMASYGVKSPLIAINAFGTCNGRENIIGAKDNLVLYTNVAPPSTQGAPLNPHHTHFVMVDAGLEGRKAWGSEIEFRARFEHYLMRRQGIPMVLLVVQGGPGTLSTVLHSCQEGFPIVILSDSGGAASVIAQYIRHQTISDPKFQKPKFETQLQELAELQRMSDNNIISLFSIEDDNGNTSTTKDLSSALLQSIVKLMGTKREDLDEQTQQQRLTQALTLSIKWDRVEIVDLILQTCAAKGDNASSQFTPLHSIALQMALELTRNDIIQLIMQCQDLSYQFVNLNRLFMMDDPHRFLTQNATLRRRQLNYLHKIYQRNLSPLEQHELFAKVVGPMFRDIAKEMWALCILQSQEPNDTHLFLWALIFDDHRLQLTRIFWSRCDSPIRVALLGSHMCKRMAQGSFYAGVLDLRAVTLEEWAIGVLDACPSTEAAFAVLDYKMGKLGTTLDLAMSLEMKAFLAHRHCQGLMDIWWRGGTHRHNTNVSERYSMIMVLIQAIFPVDRLVHYMHGFWKSQWQPKPTPQRSLVQGSLFGAVMDTLKLARSERWNARKDSPPADQAQAEDDLASAVQATKDSLMRQNQAQDDLAAKKLARKIAFYDTPVVKFVLRIASHSVFLVLYTMTLTQCDSSKLYSTGWYPSLSKFEGCFVVYGISIILDDTRSMIEGGSHYTPLLIMAANALLGTTIVLRLISLVNDMPVLYQAYQLTLAVNSILICVRTLLYRSHSYDVGVLVIMIRRMISDLQIFMEMFLFVVIGFSLAFHGLYKGHTLERSEDGNSGIFPSEGTSIFWTGSPLMVPFWAVYGAFEIDTLYDAPLGVSQLMWVYVLVSSIVLVNLLVAMFSDTYTRIKDNSELEFKFERYLRIHALMHVVHRVPPPFNLPLVAYAICKQVLLSLWWCICQKSPKKDLYRGETVKVTDLALGHNRQLSRANSTNSCANSITSLHEEEFEVAPPEIKLYIQAYIDQHHKKYAETTHAVTKTILNELQSDREVQASQQEQLHMKLQLLEHSSFESTPNVKATARKLDTLSDQLDSINSRITDDVEQRKAEMQQMLVHFQNSFGQLEQNIAEVQRQHTRLVEQQTHLSAIIGELIQKPIEVASLPLPSVMHT
eukprot:CAMPEP_0119346800 /NCGR_PEP_ID=MMETSP1333-20130426/108193_1 /TAXON_ID=418940 /ORGANISM="Scyphosphaera apsteinii, Strain RCC1455" /LENGTH=1308 /DNA_ID=CAMNT_0007359319 /DNA_START=65 /DNA_END=3991 /DNA_ORIENTATION=+